jgi:hypothetical protein
MATSISHATTSLDSFYARRGGFLFYRLIFLRVCVSVFGNVRSRRKKKMCRKEKKRKYYIRHGEQNYCIVCYSIHSYVSFIIIISVPSPVPFSSLTHCSLSFVS